MILLMPAALLPIIATRFLAPGIKKIQETRGVWHFWLVHIFQVVATQEGMQACLQAGPSWVDSLTLLDKDSRINPASKSMHFLSLAPPNFGICGFVHSCFSILFVGLQESLVSCSCYIYMLLKIQVVEQCKI